MSLKSTLPSTSESTSKTDAAGDEKEQILSGFDTVDQFTQQTLRTALQATKSSNELPACGDDFDYYSSFDSFRNVMDVERRRIIHLMKQILTHQGVKGNLSQDYLDTEDTFDTLADANDQILETVGSLLDEASGVKKKEQTLVVASFKGRTTHQASWNKKSPGSSEKGFRLLSAHNIKRPQMKFKDKVDNSNKPFVPIIRSKPNAIKSLSDSLKIPNDQDANDPKFVYPHPYQLELEEFSPLSEQLEKVEAVEIPGPVSLSPALMIATTSDLVLMLDYLKTVKEIAVDLEHHSYRTFQGFTCLIQLSTRDRDYLVDALELRSDLHLLNEVFTDPSIIKVFHGADSDIEWLQRDFGVYVVNMFDTGQAARVLHYARFSLAHLLEVCCQVTADKQYQLADWRIRPLPCELIKYAQEDTHYLLYIHDVLRNELIEKGNEQKNLLTSVFQRSKQICSKVYNRPILTEDSYLNLYHQSKKVFNSQQIHCLKKLYEWRDKTARLEDESPGYVLPKHMLLQIADILPRERQGVLACCNPTPPLVRQNVIDLHSIVMEAREVPLVKVTKRRSMLPSAHQHPKFQPSLLFHSKHDHSHPEVESGQEKTTLLDPGLVAVTSSMFTSPVVRGVPVKESPLLSAFGWKPEVLRTEAQRKAREVKETFRNPFELYLPKPDKVGTRAPEKSEIPKWKFMEHTTPEPAPKPQVKGIRPEDKPLVTKEEEETMVPLSHQFSNPKKRKKSEEVLVETTEVDQPRKKKEKVLTTETFQPYDYSQANMGMFDSATKKDKKKYDPDGALRSKKEHKVYKSKLPAGTGKKSYTYGKGDKSSSKQNWPKR